MFAVQAPPVHHPIRSLRKGAKETYSHGSAVVIYFSVTRYWASDNEPNAKSKIIQYVDLGL